MNDEPPELNTRGLWLSMLGPPGLVLLVIALLSYPIFSGDPPLVGAWLFISLATAYCIGWGVFARMTADRYQGSSHCLLVFFYPLAQLIILLTLALTGCALYFMDNPIH
ncbi:hypothetical protein [Roseibacillus ishigakijimensis]|uniref:Uncharacterized protein n=1 Tax=Roseibacillus ishigakijimensis TaxID=454146 RepID=A0A934RKP6_9BACT|nr:hypothetical protein [Roseibacillus ishigakijimensis]MBK1833189.1 hypothetical protein [Roseibacillus ishigakijimensis]